MTKFVTYFRGEGGYILTAEQRLELENLRNTLSAQVDSVSTKADIGLGVPIYQMLLDLISYEVPITDGSEEIVVDYERVPIAGVDAAVFRWIEGAVRVNGGDGFFADFIREYTKIQYQLRGGDLAQAETLNQEASNRIALNLANDILNNNGILPGIGGLGALDAGAAASTVFENIPSGEGADYAPWAGTLLFPFLGYDSYVTDMLFSSEQVVATIDRGATGLDDPITIKYVEGTFDLIAAIQSARLASMQAVLNAGSDFLLNTREALINLIYPDVLDTNQHDLMAQANDFFNQYYGLTGTEGFTVGADLLFNRFNEFWEGITFSPEINYLVGKYGDDANLSPESLDTRVIVHAGDGNDTVAGSNESDLIDGGEGNDTMNGLHGDDYLYGGVGDDKLFGGDNNDRLVGMTGNDELTGGVSNDRLEGGEGNDTYYFNYGDGNDTVNDTGGSNTIYLQNSSGQTDYANLNGLVLHEISPFSDIYAELSSETNQPVNNTRYIFNGSDLMISIDGGDGGRIIVENFSLANNNFGLTFVQGESVLPDQEGLTGTPEVIGDGVYYSNGTPYLISRTDPGDYSIIYDASIYAGNLPDHELYDFGDGIYDLDISHGFIFFGSQYRDELTGTTHPADDGLVYADKLYGFEGDDILRGESENETTGDKDILSGGHGSDRLYGGTGDDILFGMHDDLSTGSGRAANYYSELILDQSSLENAGDIDYLDGGDGQDNLVAGTGNDILIGGNGVNGMFGFVGNDVITGGNDRDWISGDGYGRVHYLSTENVAVLSHKEYDFSLFSDYNDTINAGNGKNYVNGDAGDDVITAGDGDDDLYGDQLNLPEQHSHTYGSLVISYYSELAPAFHGNDTIAAGDGADDFYGNGGNDTLFGEAGNDFIHGDDFILEEQFHGDDFIDGGEGADTIIGGGGKDTIDGGAGNDQIYGDYQAVEFNGTVYEQIIVGDDDTIQGGDGEDLIWGNGGNDTLYGGNDNDQLSGEAGNDFLYGEAGTDLLIDGEDEDCNSIFLFRNASNDPLYLSKNIAA